MLARKQSFQAQNTINSLSALLRARFLRGGLTLKQAEAFATFPNPEAQDALFKQLGSLANNSEILHAISCGATVIPIPGDFLILPSRMTFKEKL